MASKKVDGVFAYMTPEEIDEHIKATIESAKPGRNPASGWKDADIMIRRQVILEYVAQGLSKTNIMRQICDRWGVKKSCAYKYIIDAMDALVEDNADFIKYNRTKQEERLENIMTMALEDHMYDTFLKASDQLNKIYGLYNEKKEIDLKTDIHFDFDE